MTDKMYINWDVIVRRILGHSSVDEDRLVDQWFVEDEMNRIYYEKAKYYFDKYYTGEENREVDVEDAWHEFMNYTETSSNKVRTIHVWKYVAAVVLPLFMLGVGYLFFEIKPIKETTLTQAEQLAPGSSQAVLLSHSGQKIGLTDSMTLERAIEQVQVSGKRGPKGKDTLEQRSIAYNVIIVPKGGEYDLTLMDGTTVTLNADSKLSIPEVFVGEERRVCLEGEAFFSVAKDVQRPFIVETLAGEVNVLGTEFNLSAYPDDEYVQTTLVEGEVAFLGKGMVDRLVIEPGEQVTYNKVSGEIAVKGVNTMIYTAWTQGKWIIEGMRLEDMMKQIARWYDVTIFYQNQAAKELIFTGDLERYNNCEMILDIIAMTTNVEFIVKDRVITVIMR